jgi:hypothetical protein
MQAIAGIVAQGDVMSFIDRVVIAVMHAKTEYGFFSGR